MSARQPVTRSKDGAGETVAGAVGVGDADGADGDPTTAGEAEAWLVRGKGVAPQPPRMSAQVSVRMLPDRSNRPTSGGRVDAVGGEPGCGQAGGSADRPKDDAGLLLIDGEGPDEPAMGLRERLAGPSVGAQTRGREDEAIGAPIRRGGCTLDVPLFEHRPDVMRHRRGRHPGPPGELARGVRPLVEENAVDGVLVGSQAGVGEGAAEQRPHLLVGGEQVEEQGEPGVGRTDHPPDRTTS